MTDIATAWAAGVDAVLADNTLNRGGFVDALQTVITARFNNGEGNAFTDAIAAEYARLGVINNPTYNNLRAEIIREGRDTALALFDALAVTINAARVIELRTERDEVNTSIARLQDLRTGESRQVREAINLGVEQLRVYREQLRDELRNLTGDPDATA